MATVLFVVTFSLNWWVDGVMENVQPTMKKSGLIVLYAIPYVAGLAAVTVVGRFLD